jgi:Subtilase family
MRTQRWHRGTSLLLCAMALACSDQPMPTQTDALLSRQGQEESGTVPERGADADLPRWSEATDAALWQAAVTLDTLFAIGLKSPGARRGAYKGNRLIVDANWRDGQQALRGQRGLRVVAVDPLLPVVHAKILDLGTLARVRRLPFVDYLEPAIIPTKMASDPGCSYPTDPPAGTYSGDFVPYTYRLSHVDLAWHYANGQGEVVGITDTGVDVRQYEMSQGFLSGQSVGRWFGQHRTTDDNNGDGYPDCSHGTRMGGLIAAPRNGMGAQGIAWKASLWSSWVQNSLLSTNGVNQSQGIRDAGAAGSRTITIAWTTTYHLDYVSDEIDRLYYQPPPNDVVFVAATGTTPCDLSQGGVLFPASKWNVLAVGAANTYANGSRDCQSHYGPQMDVVAYAPTGTVGPPGAHGSLSSIDHTSGATAFVGGVVALVRSRFPLMRNYDVMNQVRNTAGTTCGKQTAFGPIVNALAAVGGPCVWYGMIHGDGEIRFDGVSESDVVYRQYCLYVSGGVGNIRIYWSGGTVGDCATYEIPRGNYGFAIGADVRDLGNNVYFLGFSKVVDVYDDCQNPDIPITISLCGLAN